MAKPKKGTCVDCRAEGITTKRKAPHPGPRCASHHRAKRDQRKSESHAAHVENTYSITIEQYNAILEAQGGVCAICRKASGKRRNLSVDHDHSCCKGPTSCGRCVRSLICRKCNDILGYWRDDPEVMERAILYLVLPPGKELLSR